MNDKTIVYGVDVSKTRLDIGCYEMEACVQIANAPEPIATWLKSLAVGSVVAMEATGEYHQLLAHLAQAAGMVVFVLNPQWLRHYARAIGQRGKTDRIDARMIARYAVHEHPRLIAWQPPAAGVDMLSKLLIRRQALVGARQMLAQSLAGMPELKAQRQSLLKSFKRMIVNLELLIAQQIARVPALANLNRRLITMVGVGKIVAAQLVASLTRLAFRNVRAFVAYTGLDPRPEDSGNKRGRRVLSKHGNALLRCLLYNGAMAATRSQLFKPLYLQLRARGLATTEAIVIIARKLARIAFALFKSGESFDAQKHFKNA